MSRTIHTTSLSLFLLLSLVFSNRQMFAQNSDTAQTKLKFPISDRNTSFVTTKSVATIDLKDPSVIIKTIEYDPKTNKYIVYEKIGDDNYKAPTYMTYDEYLEYSNKEAEQNYFQQRSRAIDLAERKSKQPFLYQGPELTNRFLGGTKIEIKPQGNVDVTIGVNSQRTDNPVLLQNQRRNINFDFDMNIQLGLQASIGDKIKLGINYNTKSGFAFENQMKLGYKGKEDDIIQNVEFGNVSLPLRSALIKGPQNLFGVKTQLKFGRLMITNILSQQKSKTESVRIENGAQTKKFTIKADEYEDNRHFFISQYFRDVYEQSLSRLPFVSAQTNISKIEVWVTNKTRQTIDVREMVAFQDIGEINKVFNPSILSGNTNPYPESNSNNLYNIITRSTDAQDFRDPARCISFLEHHALQAVDDYEKVSARKLASTEYTFNAQLGYISLNQQLRPDEVLGVAIQYTVNGQVYQLGEFASDLPPLADTTKTKDQIIAVKMLKATSVRTVEPIWDLMMKNVYALGAYNVSPEQFFLDVYYQDPGGGQKRYLPTDPAPNNVAGEQLIKVLNLDNLNNQLDPQHDGKFDFIPGVTIQPKNGKIIFPVLEPFGTYLANKIGDPSVAAKYAYRYLYDTTKYAAQQFPEFNRFLLKGSYRGTDNSTFRLPGAFNLPQGSVTVNAGGNQLTENVDYTVNYGIGEVVIINQGVLNSGVPIDIKFENNVLFGVVNKSLFGTRLDYAVNKNINIGFTHLRLAEKPFTQKVNFNDDPVKNNVIGIDFNYATESKGMTRIFNKITAQDTKEPSKISASGEAALFLPGHSKAIDVDNAGTVYVDDFEGASTMFDLKGSFLTWSLASAPKGMLNTFGVEKFPEARVSDSLIYGFNRAKLAWYSIDPVYLGSSNSNPLNSAAQQEAKNNIYTRQFYEKDVFKNRQNSTITNPPLFTLDLSYFPKEKGPYNFETMPTAYSKGINAQGKLNNPETRWGGIMRTIESTSDFEAANIEFVQFWVLDPFKFPGADRKGNLYVQLGTVSEDILKDSRKQYENGLPRPNGGTTVDTSAWGVTPTIQNALTNSFDADPDVIKKQDVGLDGLENDAERNYYANYISNLAGIISNQEALDKANADPSGDDYVFNRDNRFGSEVGIITRYKDFSNSQGNSSNNLNGGNVNGNSKTQPDNEDLNNDNTLNETEEYFQYRVAFDDNFLANSPYVASRQGFGVNGNDSAYWYQIKIPVKEFESRVGNIADFRSIRFVRLIMSDFTDSVTLRLAEFGLVRNQWRKYDLSLSNPGEQLPGDETSGTEFNVASVSVEENATRTPIPYAIPPGINREQNISGYNNALQNEQAMSLQVCELNDGDARAVFKTTNMDLRNYKRMKLFTHAENFPGDKGSLYPIKDNDLTVFMRIGSDFTDNYYEYEIPLKVTPAGNYNPESEMDKRLIWPDSNQMNVLLDSLTAVKQKRNQSSASLILPYDVTLANGDKISIKGNPDLGVAAVFMIGVRNPKRIIGENDDKDDGMPKCAEIWVNELRMSGFDERMGWAALGRVDMQLGNLGNVIFSGNMHSIGYGDLEQRLNQRYRDNYYQYDIATNLQLGNLIPEKAGLQIPVYAQFSQAISTPQYDPYELDVELKDKFEVINTDANLSKERKKELIDSTKRVAQDVTTIKSFNVTNLHKERTNPQKEPRVYDVENFNFTYAFIQTDKRNPIIENERITRHRGSLGWNFSPKPLVWTPFKKLKNNSIHLKPIKEFNLNLKPNSVSFRTDVNRQYGVQKIRDIGGDGLVIQPTYDKYFTWDRFWSIKYNLTKSINIDFTANNKARVDEPDGAIDTKEKRDTVRRNFWKFGRNVSYDHIFNASYNLPFHLFPSLDWINVKTRYSADYSYLASSLALTSLGNTVKNGQNYQVAGDINFKSLFQKSKFLKPYTQTGMKKTKQEYADAFTKYKELESRSEEKIIKKKQELEKKIIDIELAENDTSKTKADIKKLVDEKKQLKNDLRQLKLEKRQLAMPENPNLEYALRPLLMLQRASISYDVKGTTILPGLTATPLLFGQDFKKHAPGAAFLFGAQRDSNWLNSLANRGLISSDTTFNYQFIQTKQKAFNLRVTLEPYRDLRVEISMQKTQGETYTEFFKKTSPSNPYQHLTPQVNGNMSMSFLMLKTIFSKVDENNFSNAFYKFQELRETYSNKFGDKNPLSDSIYINDSISLPNFKEGYGPFSQDVLVPSLIAAYTGKDPDKVRLNPLKTIPLPNWRITYNGFAKTKWGKKLFTTFNITHGYTSTFSIGSYVTNLNYLGQPGYFNEELYYAPERIDSLSGNYYSYYSIPQVTITEQLSPLIGIEISWKNSLITNFEFKKSRTLGMSLLDYRLTETRTTEYVAAIGYKLAKFKLPFKIKGKKITLQNDINLRADFSYRDDKTVNYRLDQNIAEPTRGQKTISLAATIDYIINNKLNVRLFYDFRRITPATLASYPQRSHRGGITFRFSLTP
ncbi:MAG TPA: cell surface protein SprA [Chitinophagales bacterium]|nr:cell surface protein SprA [Chitinophagales bacterium]MBP6153611.1 cell surface protein SprA [Chitinophagales bacterium]HQV77890.1 cell surface protein SprA [Chitinophagales bacterium]HQW78611.1 cell surface protein SprA [Chitinophagales bacterium]HRB66489.1 cell surface protein SprA [Chitinophagales bacterium]